MEYRYLIKDPATSATWTRSTTDKFGKLIEVLKRGITGIQMIKMVYCRYIPKDRKVTYKRLCATIELIRKRRINAASQ